MFLRLFIVCAFPVLLSCQGFSQQGNQEDARLQALHDLAGSAEKLSDLDSVATVLMREASVSENRYYQAMAYHHLALVQSGMGRHRESNVLRRKAIALFESDGHINRVARQYLSVGNNYANLALYDSALLAYSTAEKLAREARDTLALSGAILNTGSVYHEQGEREKELETLIKAQNLARESGDSSQLGVILSNLAIFYLQQGDDAKAMHQAREVLDLYSRQGDVAGVANVYGLFAQHHFDRNRVDSALYFLHAALEVYEEMGDVSRSAFTKMNRGQAYGKLGRWTEARADLEEAYALFNQIGEKKSAGITLHALATCEEAEGNTLAAIKRMEEAVSLATSIGAVEDAAAWNKELAGLYAVNQEFESAYISLLKHSDLNDSLQQINRQEAIQEMAARYETEKKQLEIDNLEKEKILKDAQIAFAAKQQQILWGGLVAAILLMLLALFAFMSKRKDNKIIREQKREVEMQRDTLNMQKLLIEEKNREITDSIHYAKRIQTAILPPARLVSEYLGSSFVMYKPKDVVAGDFYWMEPVGNTVYFAAADCTGHGVPGAMVSVICNNGLNRSVREFGLRSPAEILNKTRELVIREFEKSEVDVQDGMDISLCAMGPILEGSGAKFRKLQWAGANNPLWVVTEQPETLGDPALVSISEGNKHLCEIKGDKQPIGMYHDQQDFSNHVFNLHVGDMVYLFSDGFQDQFGGENGKKFKSQRFKKVLLGLASLPAHEQLAALHDYFETWRGNMEQVDDVCVIGVRL